MKELKKKQFKEPHVIAVRYSKLTPLGRKILKKLDAVLGDEQ